MVTKTTPTARSLLSDAITAFEKTHITQRNQVDLSDEDDRKIYNAMVGLLFGNDEAKNG